MNLGPNNYAADAAAQSVCPLSYRAIAGGEGWSITEVVCRLGPRDRPFEERHEDVAISAVVEGSFQYRSPKGKALLYPGSFLLGNMGACFECGHEHGSGDRCIAFHFEPWFFEEIAAAAAGSHRFRFRTAMLPAMRELAAPIVEAETIARSESVVALDELAIRVAETVIKTASGAGASTVAPSPRDQRRISDVLCYIEQNADHSLDLANLAAIAFMSKYHFLRTFSRIVGVTPHQFLLGVRMRRAAIELCTMPKRVAAIALNAGFNDLSTFNSQFRQAFGASPSVFRRARGQASARSRA